MKKEQVFLLLKHLVSFYKFTSQQSQWQQLRELIFI